MIQDIYARLREVFVLLEQSDRLVLAPFDLDTLEYSTLLLLDTGRGQRLVDLRERLLCDKSKMTRIVDHFEERGFARRAPDPEDRRAWRVFLTDAGAALRTRAQEAHVASLQRRFDVLDDAERVRLHTLLDRLRAGLYAETDVLTDNR